jgi:hypothetical protein
VGPTLSKKAKAVSAQFEERHGAKTVKDFKQFVDRLPQMQVADFMILAYFRQKIERKAICVDKDDQGPML